MVPRTVAKGSQVPITHMEGALLGAQEPKERKRTQADESYHDRKWAGLVQSWGKGCKEGEYAVGVKGA